MPPSDKDNPLLSPLPWVLAASVILGLLLASAHGATQRVDPKQKSHFNKLLSERNQLAKKLEQLDRKAADAMRNGEDPVVVHAEQIGVQDQLDLIELRLEILGTRLGLDVPTVEQQQRKRAIEGDPVENRARATLERGRARTITRLQRQTKAMLASLDFSRFVAEPESSD